jgi:hypothetical protein
MPNDRGKIRKIPTRTKRLTSMTLSCHSSWFGWLIHIKKCLFFKQPSNDHKGLGLWCLTPLSIILQLYHGISALLVEETGVPGENHWPVVSYWKTLNCPLWPWSYGSWIYNYLCNQCLSPLMLWFWILLIARCTRYNIMW